MRGLQKYVRALTPVLFIGLCGCQNSPAPQPNSATASADSMGTFSIYPANWPAPSYPKDNYPNVWRQQLGEKLFFDPRLSANGNLSCASCHKPQFAFAETVAVRRGHAGETLRNSPTLLNVAYQRALLMEGGAHNLEIQALGPMSDGNELGTSFDRLLSWFEADSALMRLHNRGFDEPPSLVTLSKSLAAYQRTLFAHTSRFDLWQEGDSAALTPDEKDGYHIFNATGCATCHPAPLFTDLSYHNIGLYQEYPDEGRARLTRKLSDLGKFKTPTLRNVSVTAPYMHDGSLPTLSDVITHFNSGGAQHPNKSARVAPLRLSSEQMTKLEAFLMSLTDSAYASQNVQNRKFVVR